MAYDQFGGAVAIEGTTALVPVSFPEDDGQGKVYVFTESNGVWNETQELSPSDGSLYDEFGSSIALLGTTALIGADCAPYDVDNRECGPGVVYAFSESGGTWTQTQEFGASDGVAGDFFGGTVALSGTTALVSAVFRNGAEGAAYVFNESSGNWSQTQELTPSDGAPDDFFGATLGLSGSTALVGAVGHNDDTGAVYVFDESNSAWSQAQELTANDNPAYGRFGWSIALDGTTALIGAPGGSKRQGTVFVFSEENGIWSQAQKLTASGGFTHDKFGWSLAADGATAIVGALCAASQFHGRCGPGAAYIFREENGIWSQTQKLTASDGMPGDYFGGAVGLSGTVALIGAYQATVNGNFEQGAAYFYSQDDFDLAVSAPQTVGEGEQYVSQTIATNNATSASAAVSATVAVPAGASFVSAASTQGSCSEAGNVVTCDFGQIAGNAGAAIANVTLKATGNAGNTIDNTASIVLATPPLTASAATTITEADVCPDGYSEYGGDLGAHQTAQIASYEAAAGEENAILSGPEGIQLYVRTVIGGNQKLRRIPGNELHRHGPAGTYTWGAKAGDTGGGYTLCIEHP